MRLKRLLRSLVAGLLPEYIVEENEEEHFFTLRCHDEAAAHELLGALGLSADVLAECADDQECDDDLSNGADVVLMVYPDYDGSFEWILEVRYELPHEWPLTLLTANYVAEKLGAKHYEELTDEELLAGQTMWMAPPPIIVKTTLTN